MKELCVAWAGFLSRRMWLYWALQFAWGLPMNVIGGLVFLIAMAIARRRPETHGCCPMLTVGRNWGGLNMGVFCLVCANATPTMTAHEVGHSFQNALFGPFMPFVVAIPSAVRYWYRIWAYHKGKNLPAYDAIWFEGSATEGGIAFLNAL